MKIILHIEFKNNENKLKEIQNRLLAKDYYVGLFELDDVLNYELNLRNNFFLIEDNKLSNLHEFLTRMGFEYNSKTCNIKEFYDGNKYISIDEKFESALKEEILEQCTIDDILDKINKKGIKSLTPLDKQILSNFQSS